jgi:hypothetical protein
MDEQTQYQFGDAPVSASMSTHRESPEAIIKIADTIWAKVKSSKVPPKDNAGNDALLKELQEENKDFMQSFPIVLRWMVQARQYGRKAFRLFLEEHASKKMDSREDYLRLQAEYLVLLFRESNKRAGLKQLSTFRERIIKQLLEDDKRFLAAKEAADKQIVEEKAARAKLRREALFLFASRHLAETSAAAEPVAESAAEPVAEPTAEPSAEPVAEPSAEPVAEPSAEPSAEMIAGPRIFAESAAGPGAAAFGYTT